MPCTASSTSSTTTATLDWLCAESPAGRQQHSTSACDRCLLACVMPGGLAQVQLGTAGQRQLAQLLGHTRLQRVQVSPTQESPQEQAAQGHEPGPDTSKDEAGSCATEVNKQSTEAVLQLNSHC